MAPTRELLPEQAAAAYEINKHISVTAGPGSGKTTVLVERYVHILRQHKYNIDQIVAITFTNRAANEMRERLRQELSEILKTSAPTDRPRWLNYKRTLDGAVITTIHGFCARLLREFPVEARVDPQFLLLDEHRAAMLLESVVEEVLSEFISHGHIEVSRLTLGVGRAKLAAALAQLYREARGQGVSLEDLARLTASSHATELHYGEVLQSIDRVMDSYLAVPRTTTKAKENHALISEAWPRFRSSLKQIPEHETLAQYCQTIERFRELRPQKRGNLVDHISELDELIWGKELSGKLPRVCFDLFAGRYALEIINLLTVIDQRLNAEKQRLSALDFDDLEIRTIELLKNTSVMLRASDRYRFFLVDEFQDTNGLQRELLEQITLRLGRAAANLFIVGDRKQSIYGFRGADVDVFREMTNALLEAGGEPRPLHVNFRSQPPLINFFNYLFKRLFQPPEDAPDFSDEDLAKLGYVSHEASEAKRDLKDQGPLVELLIATRPPEENYNRDFRELDAIQLANRIISLKRENPGLNYSDIALLFRAMTQVHFYEAVFRRAGIPYQTVLGRGFYDREEITDLIQLLRFLDNRTDEIALAAVLRSPICGISDNALLALRSAPPVNGVDSKSQALLTRPLYRALRQHRDIQFINNQEHELLDRAANLIGRLVARRHHYTIEDLLRFAVDESEYETVIAANFDGAQRLANVDRLFSLAARFESSGNHLIRDFVRYVEEFEAIGSRESEGQIDEAANAVKLMTIHQAKGLEFTVVIIPDLHRSRTPPEFSFALDRHRGVTLKVPDGRGRTVAGHTFSDFEQRQDWREQFENMRLLYVAATRAEDRLILSGATEDLSKLSGSKDIWLKWIWHTLELENHRPGLIDLDENVQLKFVVNVAPQPVVEEITTAETLDDEVGKGESLISAFPLLQSIEPDAGNRVHRFSVTQLINYQRCPRQYYFDRILQLPTPDELAAWNNTEAPEPGSNLTATLKGSVIHRFCELYTAGQDAETCLRRSFDEIVRVRQSNLADRIVEVDVEAAIKSLLPLATNYLNSDVFKRVEGARNASSETNGHPSGEIGIWSELSFRLRRPLGVVSGTIDKLLITRSVDGEDQIEIIDFKTNRLAARLRAAQTSTAHLSIIATSSKKPAAAQFAFDFESIPKTPVSTEPDALLGAARDYQLQMQAYALAIRELSPALSESKVRVTLHFLEPNIEFHLQDELLDASSCRDALDAAIRDIITSHEPADFEVNPAPHCRTCSFLQICSAGRAFLQS